MNLNHLGSRLILIEPGACGFKFLEEYEEGRKTSSLDNDSLYMQMANNMSEAQKQMAQNSMHPSEVAKAILQVVTSDNPDLRYVVGTDGYPWRIESRRNMSDTGIPMTQSRNRLI